MKVTIDGVRLDTAKNTHHWELFWLDESSNQHTGHVYVSSEGQWYVYTPSQWSNMHNWELSSAVEVLNQYDRYLTEEQKTSIADVSELTFD